MPERYPVGFRHPDCPCTFEYPSYSKLSMKTTYFMEQPDHPCWFNLNIPYFNGVIHMSYMPVDSPEMLERVINDGFKFAFKHTIRADYIDKTEVHIGNVHGVLFDIGGDVASSVQFYATDSATHFLRGSLYFNQRPNVDSLRPVIDFVREDILALVRSIDWGSDDGNGRP